MSSSDINPPLYGRALERDYGRDSRSRSQDAAADRDTRRDWQDRRDRHEPHAPHGQRGGYARRRDAGFLSRTADWLDSGGKPAWIAATIVGFMVFAPVGVGLLAYMIWSKRMFSKSDGSSSRGWACAHRGQRHQAFHAARAAMRPSGNSAFDAYKTETLRRLEDEQSSFEDFLERLRDAKDKAEFDQFMDDRARGQTAAGDEEADGRMAEDRSDAAPEPRRYDRPGDDSRR